MQTGYGFKITQKTVVGALGIQKALPAAKSAGTEDRHQHDSHIPTAAILASHYLCINKKKKKGRLFLLKLLLSS